MKIRYILIISVLLLFGFGSLSKLFESDKIAVLEIKGVIENPKKIINSLADIKNNEIYKGLIVRIDSPGGTVGSSQEIYSFIKEIRKKIPVVASIVDIGASGGYLIACSAEHIIANPGSITGSIGVISQYYDASKLLSDLGLNIEVLKSGEFKDSTSPTRPLNENEKKMLKSVLEDIHNQFKNLVKKERNLTADQLDFVSKGQIFTGFQAKQYKLVDDLGGILLAKKYIENKVNLIDLKFEYFPKKKERLLDQVLPENINFKNVSSIIFKKIFFLYTP
tara:strand:+ start:264 stop:1097 length:834 start_codon:yes stop_codon:yes gene_type:complete